MSAVTITCPICHTVVHHHVDECPACHEPLPSPARSTHWTVGPADMAAEATLAPSRLVSAVGEVAAADLRTPDGDHQPEVVIELAYLPGYLQPAERLLHLAVARYRDRKGLLALTDHRLLFISVEFAGARVDDMRFEKMEHVRAVPNGRGGRIEIAAFGSRVEISHVQPPERGREIVDDMRRRAVAMRASVVSSYPLAQPEDLHPIG